jgi:hypothetical protein
MVFGMIRSVPSGAEGTCGAADLSQGLKPDLLFAADCGTTEVVPCYKTWFMDVRGFPP